MTKTERLLKVAVVMSLDMTDWMKSTICFGALPEKKYSNELF